jgi:hypothetical protein
MPLQIGKGYHLDNSRRGVEPGAHLRRVLQACLHTTVIVLSGILLTLVRADARPYTNLYVFGGNWEEIGNNQLQGRYPDAPYLTGRRTNGESYVEHLALALGLGQLRPSKLGGTNYAWGPTDSPDWPMDVDKNLQEQIDDFQADLDGRSLDPDALYIVGGFQDFVVNGVRTSADTTMEAIRRLTGLGGIYFATVEKIEPLSVLGNSGTVFNENSIGMDRIYSWSNIAGAYNRRLGNLAGLARTTEGISIFIVPYRKWVDAAREANIVMNIESPPAGEDPDSFFNLIGWSTGSTYSIPSGRAHELLADVTLEAINRPPTILRETSDLVMSIGDEPVTMFLAGFFSDPDLDRISYTVSVSIDSVIQAGIVGAELTLSPISDGSTNARITAYDGISQRKPNIRFDVTVLPPPGTISISVASLSFGEVEANQKATLSFTVNNTGSGPLRITNVASDITHVAVSDTEFIIPPGEFHDVTLVFGSSVQGEFSGTLTILSNDTVNGTFTLPFSGASVIIPADPRADFNGDGQFSLSDFLLFAQAFGSTNPTFDLNSNERVDFADFIIFAQNFSRPLP